MKNVTREKYALLLAAMASSYGVADPTKKFSVQIPIETALNDAIQESSAFLSRITMTGVTDSAGQALEMGISGLLAKRTNVSNKDRQPKMLGGPDGSEWATKLTEFDVGIPYNILDVWARYPDFAARYMRQVYQSIALDRMTVGFHGQSAAAETDADANPLGQDVNIGWLKILETQNGAHFMTSGKTEGEITIGKADGNDYANLDAFVYDLYSGIPVERRSGSEVVIVGQSLVSDDMNRIISDHATTPTEKSVGIIELSKSYGGLPAIQVPRFPDTGVVVTDLNNLHLYYQESATRRHTDEQPQRNRVVDYISSNDAYAIGDVKAIAAAKAENVKIKHSAE